MESLSTLGKERYSVPQPPSPQMVIDILSAITIRRAMLLKAKPFNRAREKRLWSQRRKFKFSMLGIWREPLSVHLSLKRNMPDREINCIDFHVRLIGKEGKKVR